MNKFRHFNHQNRRVADRFSYRQQAKTSIKEIANGAVREICILMVDAMDDGVDPDKVVEFFLAEFKDELDAGFYRFQEDHKGILRYTRTF